MGRNLFSSPLISTTLAAQAILRGGGEQQKSQWLPRLAAGTVAALALTETHGDWDLTNLTCSATRDGDRLHLSGGKTFVTRPVPHGDNHDAWISPSNSMTMVQANDGGANVTYDGRYTKLDNFGLKPLPIQKPRPPIWGSGRSDAAMRRAGETGRLVADERSGDDAADLHVVQHRRNGAAHL
jgi:hypothetical protein